MSFCKPTTRPLFVVWTNFDDDTFNVLGPYADYRAADAVREKEVPEPGEAFIIDKHQLDEWRENRGEALARGEPVPAPVDARIWSML